jgi:HSP20 family protein
MDRMLEDFFGNRESGWSQRSNWDLALDVAENDDAYVIKASLPGMDPEDVDVTFRNGTLTIQGEMKQDREVNEEQYRLRERRFGSFNRSISLPGGVEADQIEASYDKGVLTLNLPKTEEVKPKRIQIRAGDGQKVIEGKMK